MSVLLQGDFIFEAPSDWENMYFTAEHKVLGIRKIIVRFEGLEYLL